jgi:hypothetical protein
MSRCFLGSRKKARIEKILGRSVQSASVRGGNEHFWASVQVDRDLHLLVNYKTGEIIKDALELSEEKQIAFNNSWNFGNDETKARAAAVERERELIAQWTRRYSA